ncbi:uncharacterized protein LOC120183571 [Hibiscus syriacus]|uniref:uncharacterized protein LOC120183571 n=1 Tax=Hibiscus syriacus TaxID=106335 RepID=UPI001922A8B3|nr:uncharacterized protein LOC120183571 [Hibiscus syriacus]
MTILDRLPIRDMLICFGVVNDDACIVCGSGMKSRDHLFVDCSYARNVWNDVLGLCGIRSIADSWDQCLNWLVVSLKGKSLRTRILKLAWTGFLYYVWEERNFRLFRGLSRSSEDTVNRIKEAVKIKLYSLSLHIIVDGNRDLYTNWESI